MYECVGVDVEVEVVLLDVLAVIALAVGEAEEPLLEDRVAAVPQREREAQAAARSSLMPGDAVLTPAVGARARVIVREVVPGVAAGAVVLAHRAPLALAEIRAPCRQSAAFVRFSSSRRCSAVMPVLLVDELCSAVPGRGRLRITGELGSLKGARIRLPGGVPAVTRRPLEPARARRAARAGQGRQGAPQSSVAVVASCDEARGAGDGSWRRSRSSAWSSSSSRCARSRRARSLPPSRCKKASFDSEAPVTAPAHWLPPEDWVYNHWLPYDEGRLYALLGVTPRRDLAPAARRPPQPRAARRAPRLAGPGEARRARSSRRARARCRAATLATLRSRAQRTITQGHLSQHLLFHSLHQFSIPSEAPAIFGVTDARVPRAAPRRAEPARDRAPARALAGARSRRCRPPSCASACASASRTGAMTRAPGAACCCAASSASSRAGSRRCATTARRRRTSASSPRKPRNFAANPALSARRRRGSSSRATSRSCRSRSSAARSACSRARSAPARAAR